MVRNRELLATPILRDALPSSMRRHVLLLLKKRGGLTAKQVGADLNITSVGARAHLAALERDGLVDCVRRRRPVGRPVHVYQLSTPAQELFPHTYRELATDILEDLESLFGLEAVEQLFQRRVEREEAIYRRRLEGKSFEERVRELARLQDEQGYLAELFPQDDGSFLMVEQNCAVEGIARRFGMPCLTELELFRDLFPDADITRQQHMLSGDLHCAYRITKRSAVIPHRSDQTTEAIVVA